MTEINQVNQPAQYKLIIKGTFKSLSVVNIFAAIFGSMLLYYWLNIRKSGGLIVFSLGFAIMAIYLISDIIYWVVNGIHEVRIAETYFEIVRGKRNKLIRINATQITDIQYSNQLSRRSLQILLGHKVQNILGIFTWYPWPKIVLTSDAFDDNEFDKACDLIESMYADNQTKIQKSVS
jgi:hypothetical protein